MKISTAKLSLVIAVKFINEIVSCHVSLYTPTKSFHQCIPMKL